MQLDRRNEGLQDELHHVVLIGWHALLRAARRWPRAPDRKGDGERAGARTQQQGRRRAPRQAVMEADPGNRASLLYIVPIGGVMVVAMKMAIAYGKKKLDESARPPERKLRVRSDRTSRKRRAEEGTAGARKRGPAFENAESIPI